jgi:hypothetical protein
LAEAVQPQQSLKSNVDWKQLITIAAAIFLVEMEQSLLLPEP